MRARVFVAALAIVAVAACGGDSLKPSEAFCNDLRNGLTPFQRYEGIHDKYTPQKFADLAYGFAAISCKDQLRTNERLRGYLQGWNINPDA